MNIIFIGTSDFAVPILKFLIINCTGFNPVNINIITQPDKPVGRQQKLQASPVKQMALKYKIPIFQPENIKDQKNIELIKKMQPDLIIVASYGQILPKEILEIPKFGCLNIHASLLPKYRGASPIQSAILNNDKETGITIILMDEKMDTGKIISNTKIKIQNNDTSQILHDKLAHLGADLLIKTLPKYIQEVKKIIKFWKKEHQKNLTIKQIDFINPLFISLNSSLKKQNESNASYTKILKKEYGKIDWTKSAQEIERQIRAFSPWPGSFTKFKDKKLKIFQVKIIQRLNHCNLQPDNFFLTENKQLAIQCGQGILVIEELQIEGKKKMSSQEFLKGHSI
ncbi:methionyl-tRNA formyltransferase [Candidatus Kuenenbacteria bacterium HGW-Kuenenbacteria-1]|uniref:Methionyl-tRNA formyltransferase n=1 Tax=Candidatus Kuenenbacteria bacterium HGW-Kuenenbacteria-1 TaxID=2013812 RepID=A0A2N1UP38_9BACT|nr:MAG: methionyl-tRNA formyltransferase [Candidatus Kuenenbacteria bacterium HGW-Kuenenbacteria-1]